jgi:hypothetical protein
MFLNHDSVVASRPYADETQRVIVAAYRDQLDQRVEVL